MVFSFGNFLKKTGLGFVSHYMTAVQSFTVENSAKTYFNCEPVVLL